MDSDLVIRLRGVGKAYRGYDRPFDRLIAAFAPSSRPAREYRALGGVDLDLRRGETFGIVGRNGSGKTTLLRIICGITRATEGTIETRGRIAPLLALGAGFNPDFTGRENVYLNASVLGLSNAQIDASYDSVVRFADIGEAINRPVSTYSSGMTARLAFATAICTEPEILVVDEILSVGDELFGRKCFARIEEMRKRGTTILFVSHSASTVLQLCDRALLLEQGRPVMLGDSRDVVRAYHSILYTGSMELKKADARTSLAAPRESETEIDEPAANETTLDDGSYDPHFVVGTPTEYPPNGALVSELRLVNPRGELRNRLRHGAAYRLEYNVTFDQDVDQVVFGFHFRTTIGVRLAGGSVPPPAEAVCARAGDTVRVSFPFRMRLLAGTYFLQVAVRSLQREEFLHRLLDIMPVTVEPIETAARGYFSLLTGDPRIDHNSAAPTSRATPGAPNVP